MITADDVTRFTKMLNAGETQYSESQIAVAIANVDVAAIEAQTDNYAVATLWDKQSTVNGVTPERLMSRADFKEADAIYIITVEDRVSIIQPFKPGVGGYQKMTDAEAQEIGNAVAAAQSAQQRFFLLLEAVKGKLDAVDQ